MEKIATGIVISCMVSSLALIAQAQDFIGVPSDVAKDAAFKLDTPASQKEKPSDATPAVYVAQGGDGATAVLNESSLITAATGARLSVGSTGDQPAKIALEDGGFQLDVGSKATDFHLADVVLSAQNARLFVAKTADGFVVALNAIGSNGQAKLTGAHVSPSKTPTPSQADKPHFPLVKGQVVVMKQRSRPTTATTAEREVIAQLTERLKPGANRGPLLALQNIEHPSDLEPKTMSADNAFENIEIEAIEVEAGCVEICLD